MKTIAVVDDRKDERQTVVERTLRAIKKLGFEEEWTAVGFDPLKSATDYAKFVDEHSICVLVMDEKLAEGGGPIHYSGHNVVDAMRPARWYVPIYFVVGIPNDPALVVRLSKVRNVIGRGAFAHDPTEFVREFITAGERYVQQVDQLMARLNELASEAASGTLAPDGRKELAALREELQTPYVNSSYIEGDSSARELHDLEDETKKLLLDAKKVLEKFSKTLPVSSRSDTKP